MDNEASTWKLQCNLYMYIPTLHVNVDVGIILADSEYPCRNWSLTPYLNAETGGKESCNSAHSWTRVTRESTFCGFKRRFASMHAEWDVWQDYKTNCFLCNFSQFIHWSRSKEDMQHNEEDSNHQQETTCSGEKYRLHQEISWCRIIFLSSFACSPIRKHSLLIPLKKFSGRASSLHVVG